MELTGETLKLYGEIIRNINHNERLIQVAHKEIESLEALRNEYSSRLMFLYNLTFKLHRHFWYLKDLRDYLDNKQYVAKEISIKVKLNDKITYKNLN